ncbi:MAG: hypothetical protein IT340_03995 [Chloroflexi bacterium]|nr:hypothetical protein [Chloroflexota bacterium]
MRHFGCILLAVSLLGCAAAPEPPLRAVQRWAEAAPSYRYERTTLTPRPDGDTTLVQEAGEVQRPDRQRLTLRARTPAGEESSEVVVVGPRAWVRRVGLGAAWEETRGAARPAQPLALLLGTLAAARPATAAGERRETDGRRCQGWTYAFDPARIADWPGQAAADLTAEATLWHEPDGAVCAQTVRLRRAGQPAGEFTVLIRDAGVPLTIEPPVP